MAADIESTALIRDGEQRDPLVDIAIGPSLLRSIAAAQSSPVLRVYSPAPTVAFSGRDCLEAGIGLAAEAARRHGYVPVRRGPGGRAIAYHPGCLGLDHIAAAPRGELRIGERFAEYGALLAGALRELGIDAQVGPIPGEYCAGEFSVNDGRSHKLIGTAQRLVPGGWLFSSMIVVTDADSVRDVLVPVYEHLKVSWDPTTVGAVTDVVPGLTVADVAEAVIARYGRSHRFASAALPAAVVERAVEAAARHQVPGAVYPP